MATARDAIPCPFGCGKAEPCELPPAGEAQLDQSGATYPPAIRYARPDCPRQATSFRATGEPWRART